MSANYGDNNTSDAVPNVDDFLRDHKEKNKLLERWPHYFPHEPSKEFDVSAPFDHYSNHLLAKRLQAPVRPSVL